MRRKKGGQNSNEIKTCGGVGLVELFTIFWRTVLIYFVVFVILRLMGKREIGKLSVFDLVISIMIAEIAVFIIDDPQLPIVNGLLPMITLVLIQIVLAYVTLKNQKARAWFDGKPSYLIENGVLNQEEMRRQRYTLDDLLMQLRERQVTNMADVEFAVLETSGKLSVIEKQTEQDAVEPEKQEPSAQKDDGSGGPHFRYEGLPMPLIMDGKVQDENLMKMGKTRFWLKNQIQSKGVYDFKEVFFCSIDHRGRMYLDKKRK
jgi:uncharacterized membrane protein YcaP (DUF421 family)